MKKSLLALAVLGAFAASAQAQTNVSIGGVIQANIKNYKVGDVNTTAPFGRPAGTQASNEWRVDDDYTSRFWLTGTEDLGGGNSALFYIENRFNTDMPSTTGVANGLGNGDTFVGLKGSWGQLTAGKHTMMYTQGVVTEVLAANGTVSAMPTSMLGSFSILSQLAGVYITTSRVNNSVMYKSPNFSGFSGSVGIAASGSNGNEGTIAGTNGQYGDGKSLFLQANYSNGPLYLNFAYWNQQTEGNPATPRAWVYTGVPGAGYVVTNADIKEYRLSGSYKFPFGLKVGLQFDRAQAMDLAAVGGGTVTASRNAWQIPVSYTFGPHAIMASYTKAGDTSGLGNNSGAKMWTLGYDYAWSKRTNVGVYYSKLSNDTNAAYQPFLAGTSATGSGLANGESASTFAVGIKHTF